MLYILISLLWCGIPLYIQILLPVVWVTCTGLLLFSSLLFLKLATRLHWQNLIHNLNPPHVFNSSSGKRSSEYKLVVYHLRSIDTF